ncbi:heme-binding domain-containing protein [Chryseosolibacter indicus]|uniref:Heme-binding domain-containing protein n=1 Tax=Chryseosolibacter indicus TaxID=2782351 RepID=A0ABS5VY25_9BACT|nr:cytochrome P460 family protein [Chryseosolibacter indicus]MBT1706308.1 heme-binding domain-containing protein [Chryseosolibacter indicus]
MAAGFLAVFLVIIQIYRPPLENPPVTGEIEVSPDIGQVLRNSCYNCHSNETKLKWFDELAPAYWLVTSHIRQARAALNFSEWDKLTPPQQKAKLFWGLNRILANEMPPPEYSLLHPEAHLSTDDIDAIKRYLVKISPRNLSVKNGTSPAPSQKKDSSISQPLPTANGIDFIPDYQRWKAISTTDRFDNGTMRVIYGNSVAVEAIANDNTNPWPDGTVFAKVAWTQAADSTGLIRTGEFKQVEFMIKDQKKYADTEGWGWARWLGKQLVPYGNDALFTQECVACHTPRKESNFVFTQPLVYKKP